MTTTFQGPDALDRLVERVEGLAAGGARAIVGIVGLPGAGKSTLAAGIVDRFGSPEPAVLVPMDGFHLADVELDRLGRRERKGAIDTFDGAGYAALLARIAADDGSTVYAPSFERTIEQPIAGAIPVLPGARVVVTEGNYLLDEEPAWAAARGHLDEVWFCEVADALRRERLIARHVRFGKDPAAARDWVDTVDEVNARRIARCRSRADVVVRLDQS